MPIFSGPSLMPGVDFPITPKKKPALPQDAPSAPMLKGPQDPFLSTDKGPDKTLRLGSFGSQGPAAPAPGTARAWSSQGPADRHTPVQQFNVPAGPQPVHDVNRPAPIGSAWSGFGSHGHSSSAGSDAGTFSGDAISNFYDRLGMPLSQVIGDAQHDEAMAKHAWMQTQGSEAASRALQQQGMVHGLEAGPQNELVKRISELSTAQAWAPSPEGTALIKHYLAQLQAMQGGGVPQPEQPAQPKQPEMTNNHPGVGGMVHAALHRGLPAAASGAGWAAGAALAPETGMMSLAVPAVASLASYFGANKLADAVDPSGVEAANEHPMASIAGQAVGGVAGYKGFGQMGSKTPGPAGSLAEEVSQTPTTTSQPARANQAAFGSEYTNPNVRQMSPFGTGEVPPGQTPVAPISRQLTMGQQGVQGSAPFAPSMPPNPKATTGYGYDRGAFPTIKEGMGTDPQIEAALAAFKQSGGAQAPVAGGSQSPTGPFQAEQAQLPLAQQGQPTPGMRSTVMPSANATQAPIATNPVQMPQQPSGVPTLQPSMLDAQTLQRLIGDPRIGPAISHDPALQLLLQKYLHSPAQ